MNNKEGKEEPWKRGKRGMNTGEGKEGSCRRGKKGMKTKEGKEETWKRGKVKPEQRKIEMTSEVEKGKPRKNLKKRAEGVGSGVIRATDICTEAILITTVLGIEGGHPLK